MSRATRCPGLSRLFCRGFRRRPLPATATTGSVALRWIVFAPPPRGVESKSAAGRVSGRLSGSSWALWWPSTSRSGSFSPGGSTPTSTAFSEASSFMEFQEAGWALWTMVSAFFMAATYIDLSSYILCEPWHCVSVRHNPRSRAMHKPQHTSIVADGLATMGIYDLDSHFCRPWEYMSEWQMV